MHTQLSSAHVNLIFTAMNNVSVCPPGSELIGSHGNSSQRYPLGSFAHEVISGLAQEQRFSLPQSPVQDCVMCCGLHTHHLWGKKQFLTLGPTLGMFCHHKTLSMDASLSSWGAVLEVVASPPSDGGGHMADVRPNLFASESTDCPLCFALTPPAPLGLDTIVQTWPRLFLYAFPLIALFMEVLAIVNQDY